MTKTPYYITTAIAYTSGKPHIGNVYEIVLADAIARFKKEEGYDVYFQTGTDEHGQKIEEKALAANQTPQAFVDSVAAQIKSLFDGMNVKYDYFIRTTDQDHEKRVQKIFKKLYDQGDIYKSEYEGWYCTPCESFYTDSQLTDGKCPDCGRDVHKAKEESYFFKLSKYQDRLMKHIEDHPNFIQPPSRKNEMVNNFLKPGLQDLAVSRTSFKWGIPVDFDDKHVVYVWIDALSNYITGLGYDVDGNHGDLYKKYWPADVHLIGKDILRFHTLYWPIMLMALECPLPKQVFGHPWLLVGDGKMSKSKGNTIYSDDMVKLFGVDGVRYIMLREMPFANDGSITIPSMVERINTDIVNIVGNLANRTWNMSMKYFNGVIEASDAPTQEDQELIDLAISLKHDMISSMSELKVAESIEAIITLAKRANKYIDETLPWNIAKDEAQRARLSRVIKNLLETIRIVAVALRSFVPETSDKLLSILNHPESSFESLTDFDVLKPGHTLNNENIIIMPRLVLEDVMKAYEAQLPKEEKKEEEPVVEVDPEATIDDFKKMVFKVGEVLDCKVHPDANKLLVSQIDVGGKVHQVVSGIAAQFKPEDLIGKKVMLVTNLKPVKLRGVLSEGMILVATNREGKQEIVTFTSSEKGSKIS